MKDWKTNLKQVIRIFIIAKMFAITPPLLALITLGDTKEIKLKLSHSGPCCLTPNKKRSPSPRTNTGSIFSTS